MLTADRGVTLAVDKLAAHNEVSSRGTRALRTGEVTETVETIDRERVYLCLVPTYLVTYGHVFSSFSVILSYRC